MAAEPGLMSSPVAKPDNSEKSPWMLFKITSTGNCPAITELLCKYCRCPGLLWMVDRSTVLADNWIKLKLNQHIQEEV